MSKTIFVTWGGESAFPSGEHEIPPSNILCTIDFVLYVSYLISHGAVSLLLNVTLVDFFSPLFIHWIDSHMFLMNSDVRPTKTVDIIKKYFVIPLSWMQDDRLKICRHEKSLRANLTRVNQESVFQCIFYN